MTNSTPNQIPNPIQQASESLEFAITRALEAQPEVRIPADFAAKVRAELPAQTSPRRQVGAGRATALIAAAILTIALFAIAPHATPRFDSMAFDGELLILAELTAIAWYFASRREA